MIGRFWKRAARRARALTLSLSRRPFCEQRICLMRFQASKSKRDMRTSVRRIKECTNTFHSASLAFFFFCSLANAAFRDRRIRRIPRGDSASGIVDASCIAVYPAKSTITVERRYVPLRSYAVLVYSFSVPLISQRYRDEPLPFHHVRARAQRFAEIASTHLGTWSMRIEDRARSPLLSAGNRKKIACEAH